MTLGQLASTLARPDYKLEIEKLRRQLYGTRSESSNAAVDAADRHE